MPTVWGCTAKRNTIVSGCTLNAVQHDGLSCRVSDMLFTSLEQGTLSVTSRLSYAKKVKWPQNVNSQIPRSPRTDSLLQTTNILTWRWIQAESAAGGEPESVPSKVLAFSQPM